MIHRANGKKRQHHSANEKEDTYKKIGTTLFDNN